MIQTSGKIFGIGLPRTGTTSVARAMLDLGYKTCHCWFGDQMPEGVNAFFDTPFYVDYPAMDRAYPESRFILTWRDPARWLPSFSKNLLDYFHQLPSAEYRKGGVSRVVNWRCYRRVFGMPETLNDALLLEKYHHHRQYAERYFQNRPQDLLILDMDNTPDLWKALCPFIGRPVPDRPFPRLNAAGQVRDWNDLIHPNKVNSWPKNNANNE